MAEYRARNTNDLMRRIYPVLASVPSERNAMVYDTPSRNGPVRRFSEPVSILLTHPWERVNFDPVRDANPFFHLMEGLAMLAGHNSVKFLSHFAKSMTLFSDDGETYNAFYGTRARAMGGDQLGKVIDSLRRNPASRQELVLLWSPHDLWNPTTKDKACNLCMLFEVGPDGRVNMTSFNRSNDAVLGGVSGANIVHLSMFQEYVACSLNRPIGHWWHVSNNLHVYTEQPQWKRMLADQKSWSADDPYEDPEVHWLPLFDEASGHTKQVFDEDLEKFIQHADDAIAPTEDYLKQELVYASHYRDGFICSVAVPVFNCWQWHKRHDDLKARNLTSDIAAPDWQLACTNWLNRKLNQA